MNSNHYYIGLLPLMLMGCQTLDRPEPTAIKQAIAQDIAQNQQVDLPPPAPLPSTIRQQLQMPSPVAKPLIVEPVARRFDVAAQGVAASTFFASLVQGSNLSVVVHPDVQGEITLSLKRVTLQEALEVIEAMYGFDIRVQGNILQVYAAGMRTETIPLNYLAMQRKGLSITSVSSGRISDQQDNSSGSNSDSSSSSSNSDSTSSGGSGSNQVNNGTFITSQNDSDFWGELQQTLVAIIGGNHGGRQVMLSPQAGLVTIRAYPNELREVKDYLKLAENHLQRQVILEAKVLEVTLSDGYEQGIQWQDVMGHIGDTNIEFGTSPGNFGDEITQAIGGLTSLSISNADFSAMINLLDTQGDVDVLSSPRVTATNNQKAVIKVGKDEYFVTNISSTTVASATPVTTPDVELTPFFSGIALDVTPQIDDDGGVLLHIHPSVIDVSEQVKQIQLSGSTLELPLAESEIRESDTVIKADSGDVVVIGGLMRTSNVENVAKIPLLGDIPIMGELFQNKSQQQQKTELIILLRPTVVGEGTWQQELQRSQAVLDSWYPSSQAGGQGIQLGF